MKLFECGWLNYDFSEKKRERELAHEVFSARENQETSSDDYRREKWESFGDDRGRINDLS